jgi:phosphatidylethanolamine/phosphatidyl-N-methylethanolamine N-methyltransferase
MGYMSIVKRTNKRVSEARLFLQKYLENPKTVGSLIPSSRHLASHIGQIIHALPPVATVELGPGTGAITQHLLPKSPTLIEIDADFCRLLRKKFPNLITINACAQEYLNSISQEIGLVVSIPLINNPFKTKFIQTLNSLHHRNLLKWCVIYTYGLRDPLIELSFKGMRKRKLILRNFPPASIWVYE